MSVLLYIETNFLMSFASGRDRASVSLLNDPPPHTRLVLPSVCFMESLSTLETLRKNHERFTSDFRNQINEFQRNTYLFNATTLTGLQRSLNEFEWFFTLFEQRLRLAISELSFVAELIEISTQIILHSGSDRLIKDTTDNLILTCILNHARSHSSEEKALLTENHKDFHDNQEVQKALREAGIKYFRNAQVCLEWLKARSSPPDSEPSPGSQN